MFRGCNDSVSHTAQPTTGSPQYSHNEINDPVHTNPGETQTPRFLPDAAGFAEICLRTVSAPLAWPRHREGGTLGEHRSERTPQRAEITFDVMLVAEETQEDIYICRYADDTQLFVCLLLDNVSPAYSAEFDQIN